jgi:periplasmic protein TonB
VTPRANAWLLRGSAVAAILIIHGAILYSMARSRASPMADSRAMFAPITVEKGQPSGGITVAAPKSAGQQATEQAVPESHWRFPPFDVWPSDPGNAPRMAELSSATGARAVPSETDEPIPAATSIGRPTPVRTHFGILRWVRPAYPAEWAHAGKHGSVVLSVHIDDRGRPVEVAIARSAGTAELDESAVTAVRNWTFTPPLRNSRPVSAWAEIELQFNH